MENFSFEDELAKELKDLIKDLEPEVRPAAERAVRYIGHWTQVGLATGDQARARENIRFETASLAQLASLTATQTQQRVEAAVRRVVSKALAVLLAAA